MQRACSVKFLRKDPAGCVPVAEKKKGVKVVGAVYDITTGAVKVLGGCESGDGKKADIVAK